MVNGTILHDSEQAKLERLNAPQYSCCGICGRPWNVVKTHTIRIAEHRGCFAQCEDCWKTASDHDIRLCNELLYYDWMNSGSKVGYSKEHLMECVEWALAERRGQVQKPYYDYSEGKRLPWWRLLWLKLTHRL
jgi:hypothetical protein